MATGKISKRTLDSLEVGAKTNFLWDTELKGFGVKITPSGSVTYVIQFRMGGRETKTLSGRTSWGFDWDDTDDFIAYPDASVAFIHQLYG